MYWTETGTPAIRSATLNGTNPQTLPVAVSHPTGIALAPGAVSAVEPSTQDGVHPSVFALLQNFPNPFNPSTLIHYSIPRDGPVRLQVFNTLGQSVATLVDEVHRAGDHQVQVRPVSLASGIYFYRLQSGRLTTTRRMVLLR